MEESKDTPFAKLREYEGTHVCAQCGARLVTIWNDEQSIYQLKCAKNHAHVGVKRIESNTTLLKRGELDTVAGPGHQADMEKAITQGSGIHSLMADSDVATGKALVPAQIAALVNFAHSISLKAELGHVCLYYGNPYVTVDGYHYLKHARELPFAVIALPMTQQERKSYQVTEGSHAFIARAISRGGDEIARGIGIITPEEMSEKSERHPEHFAAPIVHDKPQRMAEKRAEWQLLRKMVPLGAENPPPADAPERSPKKIADAKSDAEILWE
jgi:hypothetical protein